MKKTIIAAFFLSAVSLPFSSYGFDGPLTVKNQFPIFVALNQPYLEQARTEDSFTLSTSHSSVYVMENSAAWTAHLDLELTELMFRFRKDVTGVAEFGVDVPVLRAASGFLDAPLAWYHEAFGFPDYGRSERPRNVFLFDVRKNGAPVIEGRDNRAGFGDTRLTVKKTLIDGDPVLSVLGDVELPTGDAHRGYGNGSIDAGIALLLDKNIRDDARLYVNMGVVQPGDLKADQTITLRTFAYAGAGIELLVAKRLSLIVQYLAQTSPYPRTDISQIDGTGTLLVMGGRYSAKSGAYEFSLTEDPNTTGAPDFILNISYRNKF